MIDIAGHQWVLDALPMASAILDEHGMILTVNEKWKSFAEQNRGDTRNYYIGHDYIETCHQAFGPSSAEASLVADGILSVIEGAPEFRCEYPCHSDDEKRWFELRVSPVHAGSRRLILVCHFDITIRRLQQEEVDASRVDAAELAALVASSTDAIMSYDLDGRILTWNKAAADLYGYTPEEAIGQSMEIIYPDDWPVRITEYRDRIISGEMREFDVIRKTRSGEFRHIAISAAPVRGPNGDVVSISNFHRDITQQKATEEHLEFITHELRHRTKNMLALILAIERQTARKAKTIEEFHETFCARLEALAASNDLLVSQAWRPVALAELCQSQLKIFAGHSIDRIKVSGPDVLLDLAAVEAIGLGLHELGTNALKYGALSDRDGQIFISWDCTRRNGNEMLSLSWHEKCRTIDGAPATNGFGHDVLTKVAARKLNADVSYDFGTGELHWEIHVPSDRFTRKAQTPRADRRH